MARKCEICGKTVVFGHQASHSNIKTKRTWVPNVQKVRAEVDGKVKRIRVCTTCIKSGRVKRPAS